MTPPNAPTAAEREGEERTVERYDLSIEDDLTHMALRSTGAWVTYAQHLSMLAGVQAALLAARRENEDLKARLELREKDRQRWDWYEGNATAHGVHLSCWNVNGERNNGWTVGLNDEDNLGKGVDARMAIDDAMRHPERLRAALAAADPETR